MVLWLPAIAVYAREESKEIQSKVAILHFGPIGDYGWTYEGHLGSQEMAKELPYVKLSEKEDACGSDTPKIMREYAKEGYKVIFCHSYNFGKYVEKIALDYPNLILMLQQ